jgi:hypothetical protein
MRSLVTWPNIFTGGVDWLAGRMCSASNERERESCAKVSTMKSTSQWRSEWSLAYHCVNCIVLTLLVAVSICVNITARTTCTKQVLPTSPLHLRRRCCRPPAHLPCAKKLSTSFSSKCMYSVQPKPSTDQVQQGRTVTVMQMWQAGGAGGAVAQ